MNARRPQRTAVVLWVLAGALLVASFATSGAARIVMVAAFFVVQGLAILWPRRPAA
jgi:hypothetical protein